MRLIDADALMKEFAEFVKESNNSDFADVPTWNDAVSLLGSAPTVEAEPVRHGRWIESDSPGDCCYRCSECGFMRDAYLLDIGNYCPKCGAKMDGEIE